MLEYLYGKRFGSKIAWANRFRVFSNQTFSRINTPTFSNLVNLHNYPPMKMKHSVPKRRHIQFRRRVITQKKTQRSSYFSGVGLKGIVSILVKYYTHNRVLQTTFKSTRVLLRNFCSYTNTLAQHLLVNTYVLKFTFMSPCIVIQLWK
jgi:hypothetical protein